MAPPYSVLLTHRIFHTHPEAGNSVIVRPASAPFRRHEQRDRRRSNRHQPERIRHFPNQLLMRRPRTDPRPMVGMDSAGISTQSSPFHRRASAHATPIGTGAGPSLAQNTLSPTTFRAYGWLQRAQPMGFPPPDVKPGRQIPSSPHAPSRWLHHLHAISPETPPLSAQPEGDDPSITPVIGRTDRREAVEELRFERRRGRAPSGCPLGDRGQCHPGPMSS